jgi:CheY-like chemotaxis protein
MKKSILVVDDSQAILDVMTVALEAEGYEVCTSLTGAPFRQMEGNLPDLILLDVLLSGEDGGDMCQRLKSDERTRYIPVILISAHAGLPETADRCGADGFLVKPFHLSALREIVNRHLLKPAVTLTPPKYRSGC